MTILSAVIFGIFCLVFILIFGIAISGFIQAHKRQKEVTAWMRGEREARSRWNAAGMKPTGRPGTGRAQFRAPVVTGKPAKEQVDPEESFLTRMRKVFSK